MDSLRRQELAHKLAQEWTVDTVFDLFQVLQHDGEIPTRDVTLVRHDLLYAVIEQQSVGATSESKRTLCDIVKSSRMTVFLLHQGQTLGATEPISVLAYVPEWKHWFACGSCDEHVLRPRVAHVQQHLDRLNIVPKFNTEVQFYAPYSISGMTLSPPGASGQYALFYLYILMRNIRHFGYRDEF